MIEYGRPGGIPGRKAGVGLWLIVLLDGALGAILAWLFSDAFPRSSGWDPELRGALIVHSVSVGTAGVAGLTAGLTLAAVPWRQWGVKIHGVFCSALGITAIATLFCGYLIGRIGEPISALAVMIAAVVLALLAGVAYGGLLYIRSRT